MPIGNNNEGFFFNGEFFCFNEETGKLTPLVNMESLSCEFALLSAESEECVAKFASILEPLGDLEIVPNYEKPNNGGKSDKDGGDGYDA